MPKILSKVTRTTTTTTTIFMFLRPQQARVQKQTVIFCKTSKDSHKKHEKIHKKAFSNLIHVLYQDKCDCRNKNSCNGN